MNTGIILLLVLGLLTIGAQPAWPYSQRWGWYPARAFGLATLIVMVLIISHVL